MCGDPLIGDQIDRIFVETFLDHSFECFKVTVFEEDLVASIPAIQGVVDFARKVRTKSARHTGNPKDIFNEQCSKANKYYLSRQLGS